MTDDSYDNAAPSAPGDISIITIEDELKRSYLDYAMSVIVSRALPDARDGLKPVHRRILYSMHDLNMTPERSYSKCARVVGDVLGRFHPHGDASVYMALVRMAQPFSMGLMLVDGQGNFGSVDGDMPASMRYTEAKMAPAAVALLTDIEKDTVDTEAILTAVQADVSLSYRLLQYINSSTFSFREKITSIRQALTLLGVMKTRYWLRLMLYSDMLSANSNPEILRMALQRAHFLDALGVASKFAAPKNESLFLVGMLSLLEAILGVPMITILKELPLSAEIKSSLRGERGIYSDYIALATAMENLDFDRANRLSKALHIPENVVSESF